MQTSLLYVLFSLIGLIILVIVGKYVIREYIFRFIINVRHQQLRSMFEATPVLPGAIIFLGDSITEGGNWTEMFHDPLILNRGIGGDTSFGVLARIKEVTRHQPSIVFLCIGTNDIAQGISTDTIIKNIQAIVTAIKTQSPSTTLYIHCLLPVGKHVLYGHNMKGILAVNSELEKMSKQQNLTYISFFEELLDKDSYLDPKYSNDKLHLMGNAYMVWKEKLAAYIYEAAL